MLIFCVYLLIFVALCVAALAASSWYAGIKYDQWQKEFEAQGVKTALGPEQGPVPQGRLEPVFMGNEVVGYTIVHTKGTKGL